CHGTVCVVGKIRDLILQLSKSSIYSTKPRRGDRAATGNGCLCAVGVMPDSSFPYKFLLQTGATNAPLSYMVNHFP
ncbi:hypothetical protein SNC94_08895, partial [Escherichia coli]|nr:hypothetical protein [Escherichia coli]